MDGFVILAAFMLDMSIGDPRGLPHPVRCIGMAIHALESVLHRPGRPVFIERIAGVLLVVIIVISVYLLTHEAISAAYSLSNLFGILLSIFIAYTTLASRGLRDAAMGVLARLEAGDIAGAREELSMIVGRDTVDLDERGIVRAVVETVAENTSDGVVAPLFYLALGGPALAMAYKAINTLDSMVGYKNERYINFGWAAARLDDIANYIPARLTAFIICLVADSARRLMPLLNKYFGLFLHGPKLYSPWRIMLRDRLNHPSPNSGHPEAAVAASLGIRLGGPSAYGGIVSPKPYIGDEIEPLQRKHIIYSTWLMYGTAFFAAVTASGLASAVFSVT